MTRLVAALLFAALVTSVQAQDATYDPPNVPSDIIAPERPRGTPRQRRVIMPDTTPPIAVLPLDPLPEAETAPQAPTPTPVEIKPRPRVRAYEQLRLRWLRRRGERCCHQQCRLRAGHNQR